MSRLENDILGNASGQEALDAMITRSTDALLKRKNKKRLILDVDSTEDPAHGNQEQMAYNGHFGKNCFHPLFCFTSDGDGLAAKLRPGNVHSATGTLDLIKPIVIRHRKKFNLFWLRADSAFADPDTYEYCEANRIKEGKNTLRWDKTSCHRFAANEARLKMDFLAYNLLHLSRRFYLWGEDMRRSIELIIPRLVKADARIVYHARYWYVHVASAFPLGHHYRAVLVWQY